MYNKQTSTDAIKEFLIANQASIKEDLIHLFQKKKEWLKEIHPVYKEDLENQYDARIKQHIAFVCSQALALPAEYVIIEIENIDMEKYLNV
jgi:hypothetical protein